MKFPYGLSDFKKIITDGFLYCDRTDFIPLLEDGMERMSADQSKDQRFLASFLYYFGIVTLNGETEDGDIRLIVPNLVMRKLYVERLLEMLLPVPTERDAAIGAAKAVYSDDDHSAGYAAV